MYASPGSRARTSTMPPVSRTFPGCTMPLLKCFVFLWYFMVSSFRHRGRVLGGRSDFQNPSPVVTARLS